MSKSILSKTLLLILLGIAVLGIGIGVFALSGSKPAAKTVEIPAQSPASISTTQTNPDKDAYETVLKEANAKCGDGVKLAMILDDAHATDARGDPYFFTPGTCGQPDQLLELFYAKDTKRVDPDARLADNRNGVFQEIPIADWNISRQEAIDISLKNGARDYLQKNPGSELIRAELTNENTVSPPSFRWAVIFGMSEGSSGVAVSLDKKGTLKAQNSLTVFVDPKTGAVI